MLSLVLERKFKWYSLLVDEYNDKQFTVDRWFQFCDSVKRITRLDLLLKIKGMDSLFAYFDGFLKLSAESKERISASLEFESLPKGTILWKAGQRCNNLYFIQSGLVRLFFYTEGGEETTVHFIAANKFVTDLESLNMHSPSAVSCVATTGYEVIVLKSTVLQTFNNEVYEWHELMRRITEKTLFDKIAIRNVLFQKEAKERYLSFLELFPLVAIHAQANQIASFLGVSQFTLSHIKKEIADHHFLRNSKN